MEVHENAEIFGELGMNAKKAKRGEHLGIEIHHIESVRAAMKNDDSLGYTWQQFLNLGSVYENGVYHS